MNWSELPDLAAVVLLACVFASISRRRPTRISRIWLIGWLMILVHFAAFLFTKMPGTWGTLAAIVGLVSLAWGGTLFMWASIPNRKENSIGWMLVALLGSIALYISLLVGGSAPMWALNVAASLFGLLPLAVALTAMRNSDHSLRWVNIIQYYPLSFFLLIIQNRPGNVTALALNALLFTVYFGCCIHFWRAYRRSTTGTYITIAGFLAWALVFVVAPLMTALWPAVHIESQVWNLPKLGYYVVAVGMILLLLDDQIENDAEAQGVTLSLLEDQIQHNKDLALHEDLTVLANAAPQEMNFRRSS